MHCPCQHAYACGRADTVVAGFTRILAPGIVVWHNASLTLDAVAFRDITLLRKDSGQAINSTAITAYPGAGILMQARQPAPLRAHQGVHA